jgi:hypothetical protein
LITPETTPPSIPTNPATAPPVAFTPSRQLGAGMSEWTLEESDLKSYPHFDQTLSIEQAIALASDPVRVAKHSFYPFIRYVDGWRRFAKKGEVREPKTRPIRYAARADAYIFSRYRYLLSQQYEDLLRKNNIDRSVLAYRRLRDNDGKGKCNIHYARDAFLKIREIGDCYVIALDISSFFESLDHARLKSMWCRLLNVKRLPNDHFQVFKAITQYSIVDKQLLYERLGHFGVRWRTPTGKVVKGYTTKFENMPTQLCTGRNFRKLVSGKAGMKSIIETNYKPYGVPQGAPISDILANIYLFDFDCEVNDFAAKFGGAYFRYSDDILIVLPLEKMDGLKAKDHIRDSIKKYGHKLVIKETKSSVFVFKKATDTQTFEKLLGRQGRNGIEYLGFRYDGKRVYLRDSTLSNLYRKVARSARYAANALARRYPNKDAAELSSAFDYEALIQKFGRARNFDEADKEYRSWTFWTYVRRASQILGPLGEPIHSQLKNHRSIIRARAEHELARAVEKRDERKLTSVLAKPHATAITIVPSP